MLEKDNNGDTGFSLVRGASRLGVPAHLPGEQKARLQELTDELKEFGSRLDQAGMTEEFMSSVLDRLEKNLNQSNDILNDPGTHDEEAKAYAFQLILLGQELIGGYCDSLVKATPFQVFKDDAIQERRNNEEEALRRIAGVIVETRAETAQQIKRANLKARAARALGSHIKTDAGRTVAEKLLPSFFFKNMREDEIGKNGTMIAAAIDEAERQAQDNLILHSALGDERSKRDVIIREAVKAEQNRLREELAREAAAVKRKETDIARLRAEFDALKQEVAQLQVARPAYPPPPGDSAEKPPAADKQTTADSRTEPVAGKPAPLNGDIAPPAENDLDYLFGDISTGISREDVIQAERAIEENGGRINEYVDGLKQSDRDPKKKKEYNIGRFARGIIRSLAPLIDETYSEGVRETLFRKGVDLESTKMKEYLNVRIADNLKEGRETVPWFRRTLNKHLDALLGIKGLHSVRITADTIYQADFSDFVENNFLGTRITELLDNLMNREFWLRRSKLSAAKCNVLRLSIEYLDSNTPRKYKACILYIELESLGKSKSEVIRIEPKKSIPGDETSGIRKNLSGRTSALV